MRYIKVFENFSRINSNKLKENIEACLVELSDKGFEVSTRIYDDYIDIEITKYGDVNFELDEIEDEIRQVSDYISEIYNNVIFEYIPETRFDNPAYSKLEEIPDGLYLIRFDLYAHMEKSVLKTYEAYGTNDDKDWGDNGFETNENELKKRVQNIFVELQDEGYLVNIEISFMSIEVSIRLNDNVQSFEESKYINNELVKDYAETFIEYIEERNKNINSELGLSVRYELNQGQNAMHRKYIYDDFPGSDDNKIVNLKIVLGI